MFLDDSDTEFGSAFGCNTGCGDNMTSAETKEAHRNPTYNGIIEAIAFQLPPYEQQKLLSSEFFPFISRNFSVMAQNQKGLKLVIE